MSIFIEKAGDQRWHVRRGARIGAAHKARAIRRATSLSKLQIW
jgi:hypothetical protein